MIQIEHIHYAYDRIYTALRDVSVQINDGESLAIMGANGAGKTTLLKHMNGLLRPQSGRVFLDGVDISKLSVAEISRKVGLVWQNPDHQLFLDSVEKEIKFGLKNLGFESEDIDRRCEETLEKLSLQSLAKRSPFSLSGGERKRVALASILATQPRILALDEPTIGQDARQKENLIEMLREMNSAGKTVIVVTHDIEFVIDNFPRTIAMSGGRIIADGKTESVLSDDSILDISSLTAPQITKSARIIHNQFPQVSSRLTQADELTNEILRIMERL